MYRMFKMYLLLHMYICALQICTPLYLFFKFVTEKILKTGGDLPANQQDKRFWYEAKFKRKKSTNYIHYWLVFRCFLVYFIFVADPLW